MEQKTSWMKALHIGIVFSLFTFVVVSCKPDDSYKTTYKVEFHYINRSDAKVAIESFYAGSATPYSINQNDSLIITGFTTDSKGAFIKDADSATVSIGQKMLSFYPADTTNSCNILNLDNYRLERRGKDRDQIFFYTFTNDVCEKIR